MQQNTSDQRPRAIGFVNVVAAVIIIALIAGAFALSHVLSSAPDSSRLIAVVHDSDGEAYELALDQDTTLEVTTSVGTNVIRVHDGEVSVSQADCANQDCVHQGAIRTPGAQIICLPHKLWIEVVAEGGERGEMDVTAVAGQDARESSEYDSLSR